MTKNQQQVDNSQRTVQEKCDYYSRRVNDPKLTDGQRKFAERRLKSLCGGSSGQIRSTPKSTVQNKRDRQNARLLGVGYGVAKAGGRVPIQPENKQTFRDGVKEGRAFVNRF